LEDHHVSTRAAIVLAQIGYENPEPLVEALSGAGRQGRRGKLVLTGCALAPVSISMSWEFRGTPCQAAACRSALFRGKIDQLKNSVADNGTATTARCAYFGTFELLPLTPRCFRF
jgi:hypothetical protein